MGPAAILVFDLDDTLYLERDFVRSGFAAADAWLRSEHGIRGFADECLRLFEAGQRLRVIDDALSRLAPSRQGDLGQQLIHVYRHHRPAISLAPDALAYLEHRERALPSALITDGLPATQLGKIRALGLEGLIEYRLCTGLLGSGCSKPHPRAFELVEKWAEPLGLPLAYIADNPTKDFLTPRARGWLTVQVMRPERVHRLEPPSPDHSPDACIEDFSALDTLLKALLRRRRPGSGLGTPSFFLDARDLPHSVPGSAT